MRAKKSEKRKAKVRLHILDLNLNKYFNKLITLYSEPKNKYVFVRSTESFLQVLSK